MLQADVECDVLVVGGGITGVTLAWLLAEQGRSVMLLEGHEIGSGSTGNSTGNLYVTVSDGMYTIARKWGADIARQVVEEHRAAIAFIEAQAGHDPATAFRGCPLVLYARTAEQQPQVEKEQRALAGAGCNARLDKDVPQGLPVALWPALVLNDQAQFQPQAYVASMAHRAAQRGASIHEHSRVVSLDLKSRVAATATGTGTVRAREVVLATHTPSGLHGVHAEMPVHRESGVGMPLPQCIPEALARRHFGEAEIAFRVCRVLRVHAHGMQGALEQRGDQLGLSLPRQPLRPDGTVIEGPALRPLARKHLKLDEA